MKISALNFRYLINILLMVN